MNFLTSVYLMMFFFGFFFILIFLVLHYRYRKILFSSPPVKRYPFVSILVPAYNEEDSLSNTIKALAELDYPKNKREIIILNDGSTDGTKEVAAFLAKKYSGVRVLNKENSGKADSLNRGIKIAKGELLAVVDADSYPKKDALRKMVGHFEDQQVSAVTSRVLVKNSSNWLCRHQVLDYSIIAWTRKLLDFVDSVYVTNGPLSVYRASVVKKIKGFDPKNLTEDIEITWHILSKGYKTRMSYDAIVYTTVPTGLGTWIRQRVRWNLGGLQTVQKYWRVMFKRNAFGYFVVPYVSASFALAIVGFLLLARYLWVKGNYYVSSFYYLFSGYNPFRYYDFSFYLTTLTIFGTSFFILALFYYKIGFKNSQTKNQSILKILSYSFFYRSLYIVPLLLAIYKLARGDIRWYTK